MTVTIRLLRENCRELHKYLLVAFIRLTKAFDTINRGLLSRVLARCGCPLRFVGSNKLAAQWIESLCLTHRWVLWTIQCPYWGQAGLRLGFDAFKHICISSYIGITQRPRQALVTVSASPTVTMCGLFNLSKLRTETKCKSVFVEEL